MLRCKGT